jgi:LDH2 family malate/lactate/ureidoglycolate dehydrogenase
MNVPGHALEVAIRHLLQDRGLSPLHARDVALALVETSLDGIDTHGVRLLKTYVRELEGGRAIAAPELRVYGTLPAACVLDAGDALGAVAMSEAMRLAGDRAARCGVAAVAVANSNHFGAAGHYARLAAARGQIGLVFSNSDALVVPFGGMTPLNGTNPLAVAAPGAGGDSFAFDMATSHAAFSRVSQALDAGRGVDAGALQGGRLAVTPQHSVPILQPLGGAKGQGLAMTVQILCALLADMPFDAELTHLYTPPYDRPRCISHFAIAIEISGFVAPAHFEARLAELHRRFRASSAAGDVPVCVPGDRERASREQRLRDGIPLDVELQELIAPWLASEVIL